MKKPAIVITVAALSLAGSVRAANAGQFDGVYRGELIPGLNSPNCGDRNRRSAAWTVKNDHLTLHISGRQMDANIAADGSIEGTAHWQIQTYSLENVVYNIKGKIVNQIIDGNAGSQWCSYSFHLVRAK